MPENQQDRPKFSVNGIHLVRTSQQIHVQLSAMADQKASILMGATFVIFTITVSQSHGTAPPLPLLILGAAAFFSAVLAVLAILPATHMQRSRAPLNLLFFGSFTQLDEAEYIERLTAELHTDENIYRTMARDIYQNGVVLERKKYRLLGYAYRVFLIGLTASFAAFLATYVRG
jgi:hypothetical protein